VKRKVQMERKVQKSRSYQDLEVWKLSINFVKEIYRLTEKFPPIEIYGLTNQIRRAAVSIPSNIAEGQGRSSAKEFRQFLAIALGALAEIETQLIVTREINLLGSEETEPLLVAIDRIRKMIRGLSKSIA
jgi:four helix bundle protein